MIRNLFSKLFGSNRFETFRAHPFDMLYSIFTMAVGVVTSQQEGLSVFGVITFILGALLGITILLAINWEKVIEYWTTLDDFAATMNKVTNPDLWEAFGFSAPEKRIRVIEKEDKGQGFTTTKYHDLPISPAVFQSISNAVLLGVPLSENEIVKNKKITSSPKFRAFQKIAREKKWIKQNNVKNERLGFSLTRQGYGIFYSVASETVRMKLKEKDASY